MHHFSIVCLLMFVVSVHATKHLVAPDALVPEEQLLGLSAQSVQHVAFDEWPAYAKECLLNHGGYACKPPEDFGGCDKCEQGVLFGATVHCQDGWMGDACDFGPQACGGSVCIDDRIREQVIQDKSLILDALELSSIIYVLPEDKISREKLCEGIAHKVRFHHKHYGSAQMRLEWGVAHSSFGQHKGEKLYAVAFRGTASESMQSFVTNWLTNLKLYGSDLDGMVVHGGFLEALQPHIEELIKDIREAAAGHQRMLVAGHSLGGGFANLFAYFIKKRLPHLKVQLITAGSPRVGDYRFMGKMEDSLEAIYRVNAWCDPIPRTPTNVLYGGGSTSVMHAGPQITVGAQIECWEDPIRYLSVAAHDIDLYITRVREGIEGSDISLCNSTEVLPLEHCISTDMSYEPIDDIAGEGRTTEAHPAACKQRCGAVDTCAYFSFWPDGGCHLSTADARKVASDEGVLSGPSSCADDSESSKKGADN